ncbi:MAG: hypothetical protein R3E58_10985 [Phycisphaerae bacterium]
MSLTWTASFDIAERLKDSIGSGKSWHTPPVLLQGEVADAWSGGRQTPSSG